MVMRMSYQNSIIFSETSPSTSSSYIFPLSTLYRGCGLLDPGLSSTFFRQFFSLSSVRTFWAVLCDTGYSAFSTMWSAHSPCVMAPLALNGLSLFFARFIVVLRE